MVTGQSEYIEVATRLHVRGHSLEARSPWLSSRTPFQITAPAPEIRPILKWAGGKQWLAPFAPLLIPRKHHSSTYFEPFLGGGSFFLNSGYKSARLGDINAELIRAYRTLRRSPTAVIDRLKTYRHNEDTYLAVRDTPPSSAIEAAARLIYLNRTCFNGIYRVTSDGRFNVPFGRYRNPTICDEGKVRVFARRLGNAELLTQDFEALVKTAKAGDFVFLDPPYITGHINNGFLKYNAKLFSWNDQLRLARVAMDLDSRGVYVLITNALFDDVIHLYDRFFVYVASRLSVIGGRNASRGHTPEALVANFRLFGLDTERV